jgi:peptide/nickel transport system permease protein
MKHTLRQVLRSGKFVVGFCVFAAVLLIVTVYPLIVPAPPLEPIGQGTFFPPGIYVNVYDSVAAAPYYSLNLGEAAARRIAGTLGETDRASMKEWLAASGLAESEIDTANIPKLLDQWIQNYDPGRHIPGMTNAKRNHYIRLNASLDGILSTEGVVVAAEDPATGALKKKGSVSRSDYVNIGRLANVKVLPLGTDNFGRDVLAELVKATAVSLEIGFVAGILATLIGLALGLLAGYVGGLVDDGIMFFTNLFTVIPSFVLLILISFSIGQEQRGALTIAVVIGFTSWVWTARAVRSQVLSLRSRDHVQLSKLSGHSIVHIVLRDILPYIASYAVMALILQISSGILAEAGLSILGLGPKTTEVPTLGLMMNWAMIYNAHLNGQWWAYVPVILTIALVSFSLNLMNTGLDQVFNPTLRD